MRTAILTLAAAATVALAANTAHAWNGYGYYQGGFYGSSFSAAAARIQAKHSRYGKSIHPRSYYNRPVYYPPLPARSYGRGYDYYNRGYGYGCRY